jgi:hypothetical protein
VQLPHWPEKINNFSILYRERETTHLQYFSVFQLLCITESLFDRDGRGLPCMVVIIVKYSFIVYLCSNSIVIVLPLAYENFHIPPTHVLSISTCMDPAKQLKASPENRPLLLTSKTSTMSSPAKNLKMSMSVRLKGSPLSRTTEKGGG